MNSRSNTPAARISAVRILMLAALFLTVAGVVVAQTRRPAAPRAKPTFGPEIDKVFFPDALKELGPGGFDDAAPSPTGIASKSPNAMPSPGGAAPSAPAGEGGAWSAVIAPETLEDEIKAIATEVAALTKAKGKFKSSGFKEAEVQFANLAVLFGVVANYDSDVRWKTQAGAARDLAAKVGFACKEGSDASYDAAKNDGEMLTALVRGDKVDLPEGEANTPPWPSVAEVGPLMKRLNKALEVLKPMAGAKEDFDKDPAKFARESGVAAMIGRVLQDAEYNAEDEHKAFAAELESAGVFGAQAGKQKQYDAAREAVTRMGKTCDDCHGKYR